MLPLASNIDFWKYTQILDANLWHFVAEDFVESLMFKDDIHWHIVYKFSRESKTDNKIFCMTWPAQSLDLSVCLAVKLKLHIETDVIKLQAELVNAECMIWRFIE